MRTWKADLHLHTALSPCADREMTPPAIAAAARSQGLDLIAICDHNHAGNAAAVAKAAAGSPAVIAGMEVTTREDAHVLGLFPDAAAAAGAAAEVLLTLPSLKPDSSDLARQSLLDETGRVIGLEPRMLAASSGLSLAATIRLIRARGGLAVAAHVNRPAFSVISQLGLWPADAGFDAVEWFWTARSPPLPAEVTASGTPVLKSSDGHFLSEVGRVFTVLKMREASFEELRLALLGVGGRGIG